MPTLRATLDGKTVEKPLNKTPITIGREPGLDFTIPARGASREHVRIGRLKDGSWAMKDLGSTNGTILNGQKVDTARLKHGDKMQIGNCVLEFLDAEWVLILLVAGTELRRIPKLRQDLLTGRLDRILKLWDCLRRVLEEQ